MAGKSRSREDYLNKLHWHLPRGNNCGPPTASLGTQREQLPPLCSSHHPARWCQILVQTWLRWGPALHPHSPVACTQLGHHLDPSHHGRRCPTDLHEAPQPSQHIGLGLPPGGLALAQVFLFLPKANKGEVWGQVSVLLVTWRKQKLL